MGRSTENRRRPVKGPLTVAGVAVYAIFLFVAPFEHHDLICHLKTPQHCTSCSGSLVGSDPHKPAVLPSELRDAGCAVAFLPLAQSVLYTVRSSGRSPPAAV